MKAAAVAAGLGGGGGGGSAAQRRALAGVEPLGAEALRALAERLGAALHARRAAGDAELTSWFVLFRRVKAREVEPEPSLFHDLGDAPRAGSGRLTYAELRDLVRIELALPAADVPERELKAAFVAIDAEDSGYLTAGAIGRWFKSGEVGAFEQSGLSVARGVASPRAADARARQYAAAAAAAADLRRQKDELFNRDLARELANEAPASATEVQSFCAVQRAAAEDDQ